MQYATLTAMALSTLATNTVLALTDLDLMSKVDVSAIKKAQIVERDGVYYADLSLVIVNNSPEAIKLRAIRLHTVLETKEPPKPVKGKAKEEQEEPKDLKIDVGPAEVDEIEVPGTGSGNVAGTVTKTVSVRLGGRNNGTTTKMMDLINVLGDPGAPMTLALQGAAEVGIKLPRGWVFEKNKSYEVDLRFVPTIQREALIR